METNKSLMDIINTGSVCYIKNWTSEDVSCKHTKVEFSIGEENLRNIDNQESKDYQFVHKETENMVKSFARSIISDKDSKLILSIKVAPIFHVEDARKVQQIAQTS